MKITFVVLFVLIFFSCKEKNTTENAHCKVDSNLVSEFLKKNKSNAIETIHLSDYEENGCVNVDSFIRIQLKIKRQQDSFSRVFSDALYAFLELENFEEEATNEANKENEIIRLIKWVFAYGKEDVYVVSLNNKKEGSSEIESYHVLFNGRCSPVIGKKEFTKDCFTIVNKNKKTISDKEWKDLKTLIQETNLSSYSIF